MKFKSIEEVDIRDKRVFIRVDFNVPITRDGDVADDARIKAVLPTIRHAIKEKAKVIIASHLGRPGGKHVRRLSIEPVGRRLSELLNKEIFFPEDCVGDAVKKIAIEMPSGAVMLLENLRFHRGEEENDPSFAKKLSGVVDVYVNEAFSVSQRAHASIVGILDFVEVACVGFVFGREVQYLGRLLGDPERPFVAILGGRSASQKIPIMETLLGRLNTILIGGATAFTFLKAMGKEIGKSLLDTSALYSAQRLLKSAKIRDVKISLPVDLVVVKGEPGDYSGSFISPIDSFPGDAMGVDIGPQTISNFIIDTLKAKTIFWNGPLGVCEVESFRSGTSSLGRAVASSDALSTAVGWDTASEIIRAGIEGKITHLSMGGRVSLDFIQGKELPAISALEKKAK